MMRRKKLDQNVHTLPAGLNSIRPARMVLVLKIYFLFGCLVGSWWARWIILNYFRITVLSMPSSWMTVVVHIVLFVILGKCVHWGHHYIMAGEEQEEEGEEDDDSFLVSMFE
jgi:hypothetical protein